MNQSETDSIIEEESPDKEPQAETIGNFAEIYERKNGAPADSAMPIRN